jgi:hypothetical protein
MKKLPLLLQVGAALCLSNTFAARPNPDAESIRLDEPQTITIEQDAVVAPDAADAPDAPDVPEKPLPPVDGKSRREVREMRIQPHVGHPGELPGMNPISPMTADRLSAIVKRVGGPAAGRPLVVRTSETDPKDEANLEEDMGVMAHLLEKVAGASGRSAEGGSAMGIDLYFKPVMGGMQNLYVEGYGALFMLNVNFPLMPSGKGQSEKEKGSGDSEWEAARQEVLGQGGPDHMVPAAPMAEYDEQKVNKLKDSLLEALKNGSNIRSLKSDEYVTVCVTGAATSGGRVQTTRRAGAGGKGEEVIVRKEGGPAMRSMLTIRVRKADAEAFAKDKMSLDEFRKKARITTYAAGAADGAMGGIMNLGSGGFGGGGNGFNYEIITH